MRKTPVVLGVLSMVFGGLVSLYSLFGLLSQSFLKGLTSTFTAAALRAGPRRPGAPDPAQMMDAMQKLFDELRPYTLAISGGMLFMSLALCVVGWGLYKRQAWSRAAALLWCGAALLFLPFSIWVQVGLVMPRTMEVMNAMMPPELSRLSGFGDAMMGMQKTITIVGQLVFYTPYPIVLAILMGRPSAKNDLLG
jgi:hypothetical protein